MADGRRSLTEITLDCLRARGLQPLHCAIGNDGGPFKNPVGMRDLGANTPAAPASVQLDEMPCSLLLEDEQGKVVTLPLSGAAEAVLLSRRAVQGASLPLIVSDAKWADAVDEERLPAMFEDSILQFERR